MHPETAATGGSTGTRSGMPNWGAIRFQSRQKWQKQRNYQQFGGAYWTNNNQLSNLFHP